MSETQKYNLKQVLQAILKTYIPAIGIVCSIFWGIGKITYQGELIILSINNSLRDLKGCQQAIIQDENEIIDLKKNQNILFGYHDDDIREHAKIKDEIMRYYPYNHSRIR